MCSHLWPLSFQIWSCLKGRVAPPSPGSEDEWLWQSFLFPIIALVTAEMGKKPTQAREWQEIAEMAAPNRGQHLIQESWAEAPGTRDKDKASEKAQRLCIFREVPFTSLAQTYSNIGLFYYVSMNTALNEYPKMLLRILMFETFLYCPRHRWPIMIWMQLL